MGRRAAWEERRRRAPRSYLNYCGRVCTHIRFAPAHPAITAELLDHLEDRAEAYAECGLSEAEAQAAAAMGDPEEIGRGLDRCYAPWLPRLSTLLTTLAAVILAAGLLFGFFSETAPFRTLSLHPQPITPGAGDYETVLCTGTAMGGGALGDYTLSPRSAALLHIDPGPPVASAYDALHVAVTASHRKPWLGGPDLSSVPVSYTDDRGNAGQASAYTSQEGLLGASGMLVLHNPDPSASSFTLAVGPTGEEVRVYVTLDQKEAAP